MKEELPMKDKKRDYLNSMNQFESDYEELNITNRFMFNKVMSDDKLCSRVLQSLTGKNVSEVKSLVAEKYLQITEDGRGVRYDVFVEDSEDVLYDAEMQNYDNAGELPLRTRYYQSMIDLSMMDMGYRFSQLKESYVIFICTFDPFGKGERCYDFSNRSGKKGELSLGDKRTILIYNVTGKSDNLNDDTNEFLDFVKDGTVSGTLSDSLNKAVKDARHNKEWRAEYMMHMANYWDNIEQGKELGMEIGIERGSAISLINLVEKYMNRHNSSLENTLQILDVSMEDYLKAKEIVEREELFV
jgi:predicted transposase/invertase (TIGR01784 family)